MDTEEWKEYKEIKKEEARIKKSQNQKNAFRLLDENKIPYEIKNGGIHLVVDGRIDYYPTTGKYIVRGSKERPAKYGRGIFRLLEEVKR